MALLVLLPPSPPIGGRGAGIFPVLVVVVILAIIINLEGLGKRYTLFYVCTGLIPKCVFVLSVRGYLPPVGVGRLRPLGPRDCGLEGR